MAPTLRTDGATPPALSLPLPHMSVLHTEELETVGPSEAGAQWALGRDLTTGKSDLTRSSQH